MGISICYWEPRLTSHNLLTESITVALPQLSGTQSPDARTVAPWLGQADPEVTRIVGFGSTFETWRTYREDSDIDLGVQGGDVTALSRSMPEGEFEVSLVELDLQNAEFKEHVPTHGEVLYEKQ